jgi:hypothetical protein
LLTYAEIARVLAGAFLAEGEWRQDAMAERARLALGKRVWLKLVAADVLRAYHRPPRDRPRELAAFIATRLDGVRRPPRVLHEPIFHTAMGPTRWPVPPIDTVGALAERLELDPGQLAWLADVKGLERTAPDPRLRNYTYLRVPRKHGPPRVLERPKARLKEIQRWILRELLVWIPPHDAAHGFVKGRSAQTHAALHTARKVVVRVDLEDFFAAITAGRVYGIFRAAGYPEAVAHTLTGLCTNVVPAEESVPGHFRLSRRLATPHLPQGAPTSPALANLVAFRLDARLTGLAAAIGARYSRYADDLVLSADQHLRTPHDAIAEISRGGLPCQSRQDPHHGAGLSPARDGHRRQRPPERPACRVRPAEGHHPPGCSRPRPRPRLRSDRLGRSNQSRAGSQAACPLDAIGKPVSASRSGVPDEVCES